MDDNIFLSLTLDQVIVDSVSEVYDPIDNGSSTPEHSGDITFDQTYYVISSDNFNLSNTLDSPVLGISSDYTASNDLDHNISFLNLDETSVDIEHTYSNSNFISNISKTEFGFTNRSQNENKLLKKSERVLPIVSKGCNHVDGTAPNQVCTSEQPTVPCTAGESSISRKCNGRKGPKKVWNCVECPELLSSKRQLERHTASRHRAAPAPPAAPRRLPCPECDLSFTVACRLDAHVLAVHCHYKPHKCEECGKKFFKAFDLKRHKNIHSKTKPHECGVCKKAFTDSSNLKRHMLQHMLEKPYKCEICCKRYQQLSSLRKHQKESSAAFLGPCGSRRRTGREFHCNICGKKFSNKSALQDHTVGEHSYNDGAETKTGQISDLGRNVDALIHNILSEEIKQQTLVNEDRDKTGDEQEMVEGEIIQNHETNEENSFEIELINEIDRIEELANQPEVSITENLENTVQEFQINSELFNESVEPYMNFHNFHSQSLNLQPNNINFESGPVLYPKSIYDGIAGNENVQHDHLNFENMTIEKFPDELLAIPRDTKETELTATLEDTSFKHPQVNECATIFESDVDLESSANLAANLSQLIAENNVQFVSTEDDDTFIINLNSTMDAEQLSDLLNIGIEIVDQSSLEYTNVSSNTTTQTQQQNSNNIVLVENLEDCIIADSIDPEYVDDKNQIIVKIKSPALYTCKVCTKTFKRKDNYRSHLGTHYPNLSRHKCEVCKKRFSYRSTLNKHIEAEHKPRVWPCHACEECPKRYKAAWMLRSHQQREHAQVTLYKCLQAGCSKKFHKKCDFDYHQRIHANIRPYKCVLCSMRFTHASHLARHRRNTNCTRPRKKVRKTAKTAELCSDVSTELLSDIEDLLKSKMSSVSP